MQWLVTDALPDAHGWRKQHNSRSAEVKSKPHTLQIIWGKRSGLACQRLLNMWVSSF